MVLDDTGKPGTPKGVRPVWGGADGKVSISVTRQPPTLRHPDQPDGAHGTQTAVAADRRPHGVGLHVDGLPIPGGKKAQMRGTRGTGGAVRDDDQLLTSLTTGLP